MKKIKIVDELSYLKAKNQLVKKVTGITLIPESQLVEHRLDSEFIEYFAPNSILVDDNCTYCSIYYKKDGLHCGGCPMYEDNNACEVIGSTWWRCSERWIQKAVLQDEAELQDLGEQLVHILNKRRNA